MKFRRPWVIKEIPMTFSTISIQIAIFVSKDDEKILWNFGLKTFKARKKADF